MPTQPSGDVYLPNQVPQCEYMYGCVPTTVGMLLAYYDLYGYDGEDMSNLIEGTPELNARGTDGNKYDMDAFDTVLGNFVASSEYVDRFYGTTPEEEKEYTWSSLENYELNISVWNCLADWLGTGQVWRGNDDRSTADWLASLDTILATSQVTVEAISATENVTLPLRFNDWKYGISLYVNTRGYMLDTKNTKTVRIDAHGGTFTFANYMTEIDAGHPVLLSTDNHIVLGYGYNATTGEIIFDDCYENGRRVEWGQSFQYAGVSMSVDTVTIIAFRFGNTFSGNLYYQTVSSDAYFTGNFVKIEHSKFSGVVYCSPETPSATPKNKTLTITDVTSLRFYGGGLFDHITQTGDKSTTTITVSGGSFSRGIFGGGDVKYSTVLTDTRLYVSDVNAQIVVGGCITAEPNPGAETNLVTLGGDTQIVVSDSNISQFLIGGSIIGSNSAETHTGNISIFIEDGTYNTQTIGGTLLQSITGVTSDIIGDITISISGAVNYTGNIHCGSAALKVGATRNAIVNGKTQVQIDISQGITINGSIFAGGAAWSRVTEQTTVILTGTNNTPFRCNYVCGDSSYAKWGQSYVGEIGSSNLNRYLVFSKFNGTADAKFVYFDYMSISADSTVTISKAGDYSNFNVINIESDDPDKVSLDFSNGCTLDMAGMQLQFSCELEGSEVWTALRTTSADDFSNFSEAVVLLNNVQIFYDEFDDFAGFAGDSGQVWIDQETASIKVSLAPAQA